jgi:hypothetical protein
MRRPPCCSVLLLAILGACDSVGPVTAGNAGKWSTLPNPSGGATEFSLDTLASSVRGQGRVYGVMGRPQGSFVIVGQQAYPAITLNVNYPSGVQATYSARFQRPDRLVGTWTVSGQPPRDSLVFVRQ